MAHIGIDARLPAYRVGGISNYVRRLVQALEQLDQTNQYTIFHSPKATESLVNQFGSAQLWTPCHHRLERITLSAELLRHRLDILHSPDFIPPMRGAKRHVITVHDLTFIRYPQYLTAESRRYYNDQIETAVQQADHILCDSQATKQDLIKILNVPPKKITVHMLGVDEKFKPIPNDRLVNTQHKLHLPDHYFLFVGTIEPRKNIDGLLQAYHELKQRVVTAPKLLLVGRRGWLYEESIQLIEKLDLQADVIWREDIADEQLPTLYNLATALITPSFYEGFGLPALEAMACGTVPIVSNRSSLPEIVGDAGILVNPDDVTSITNAMEALITDEMLQQKLAGKALKRATAFTWKNTAEVVLNTYQSLI